MTNLSTKEAFSQLLPLPENSVVNNMLEEELKLLNKKIVVLDDDPTGVQTVHGVSVYTDWTADSIEAGFHEDSAMFFILTNSRGFTEKETEKAHKEIATIVTETAKKWAKILFSLAVGIPHCAVTIPLKRKF